MKTLVIAATAFFVVLPLVGTGQIVQTDISTAVNWDTCVVQSSPFQANATFIDHLGSGPVSVTTAGYFLGQSPADHGLISTGGASLALDFSPPADTHKPFFDGWNWIYKYYAYDFVRGPWTLSDEFKAGKGVSFLFSEKVAGFSIDLAFQPLVLATAAPGTYRVYAFGDDAALLGSIASTRTTCNYLDTTTWENLSLETADLSNSIRGISVVRDQPAEGVFINSETIRLASASDLAAVPEPSAYFSAGLALLGLLAIRRRKQRIRYPA